MYCGLGPGLVRSKPVPTSWPVPVQVVIVLSVEPKPQPVGAVDALR
jgi:hypothetical protein